MAKILRNKILCTNFVFDVIADGVFIGAFSDEGISREFTELKFLAESGGSI